jgi:uncharacterized protein (TIGR04141 family)
MRKKVRYLNIRLLNQDVSTPEAALKDPGQARALRLKKGLPFIGTLLLPENRVQRPKWLDFLQSGSEDQLSVLSQSASALLILRTGGRHFALAFGHGRHLLREDAFERDFGLRVALNAIDSRDLRSVDMQTIEELTLHTRRQVSRGSPLNVFGLDVWRDVMRGVVGRPRDAQLARKLAGADALAVSVPIDFADLGTQCQQLFAISQKEDYKADFGFIDHLRMVRERRLIAALDEKLVGALRSGGTTSLYLAPPQPIDWHRLDAFSYSSDSAQEAHGDLELEAYLATVDRETLTLEALKQHRVDVKYAEDDAPVEHWSIYKSIVHETTLDGARYSLSGGDWFRVDGPFAAEIEKQVQSLSAPRLRLPAATAGEDENQYAHKAASQVPGLVVMDRQLSKPQGAATRIEFCDLFSSKRMLIHMKAKNRSSTLSHLFAQGLASAEALLWDEEFRKQVRQHLRAHPSHAALVPTDRPAAKDFEIVYAVITKPTTNWPLSLPFLSLLNLAHAARRLRQHGYKVSLLRIDHP